MTDEEKWQVCLNRGKDWQENFFIAVKTTGIYCRPTCSAKMPKRVNVVFFDNHDDALAEGFRPCKLCRPDLMKPALWGKIATEAKSICDEFSTDKAARKEHLKALGVTKRQLKEVFAKKYGITFEEYVKTPKER